MVQAMVQAMVQVMVHMIVQEWYRNAVGHQMPSRRFNAGDLMALRSAADFDLVKRLGRPTSRPADQG